MPSSSPPPQSLRQPWRLPALRRLQHFLYFHGTGVSRFLRSRVRPAGTGMLLSLMIATFVAIGNPEVAVYQLFCLGIALCLAALLWLPFRRAKVEAARELPAHATAGMPMHYRVHLRNRLGGTLHSIGLLERPRDPRPTRQTFVSRPEPGEGERNFFDRLAAWYRWIWLCDQKVAFREAKESAPVDLNGKASTTVNMELTPSRRGVIRLHDLRLSVPEPLGLFQRSIRARAEVDTVAVLPKRYKLPPFELPGSARFQPGGDASARTMGQSGEFIGLREYQPGDPLRLIHWATWARTGRPVVKELEDTFFPRYGLILDTFAIGENEEFFEDAVSVAASFVAAADTSESLIDLMFIAGTERVVSAGHGVGRAETLLEVLAGVEASPEEDFQALTRLVLRNSEDLAGCLCVMAGWSESRAKFMRELAAGGIECAALIVTSHDPDGPLPAHCHLLHPFSLADDLMRLPGQL